MQILSRCFASALLGATGGVVIGFLFRTPGLNPILVYFFGPLAMSVAVALVFGRMRHRWGAIFTAAGSCSLALFIVFPDPKTPLLGKLESWGSNWITDLFLVACANGPWLHAAY